MAPYPCDLSIDSPRQVAAPRVRQYGDCLAWTKIPLMALLSHLRVELVVIPAWTRMAPPVAGWVD